MQYQALAHRKGIKYAMDITLTPREIKYDRIAKIVAGIGLVLILLLLLVNIFSHQDPPPGQPGILVNLGVIDLGQGDENAAAPSQPEPEQQPAPQPKHVAPASPPPPPPAAEPEPKPKQKEVIATEDPAAIAIRKQKAREEAARQADVRRKREEADQEKRREQAEAAERLRVQQAVESAERRREEAAAEAEQKRKADAAALKGQLGGSFGTGNGRGETGQAGNQGVDNGDPDAERLKGISTGSGRVSGGLGGRGVLASPPVRENSQVAGTVVIEVCVNPSGNITRASYTQNGSSTADPNLVAAATKNAKLWKFAANELAPAEQCGRISYNFKVQ